MVKSRSDATSSPGLARLYFDFDGPQTRAGPQGRRPALRRPGRPADPPRTAEGRDDTARHRSRGDDRLQRVRALATRTALRSTCGTAPRRRRCSSHARRPPIPPLLPAAPAGRAIAAAMAPPERLVPRPLPHPLADRPVRPAAPVAARAVAAALAPPPLLIAHALSIPARIRLVRAPLRTIRRRDRATPGAGSRDAASGPGCDARDGPRRARRTASAVGAGAERPRRLFARSSARARRLTHRHRPGPRRP